MIDGIKPYPAYRDSGVKWLNEIPVHWELRRTKTLLRERSQKGFPDEPLLVATQAKGVVRKEQYENRTVLALKDLHLLKLVRVGDFVISLRSFQGGIEYAREQGIISSAYTILYPVEPKVHGFLAWLFKSKPYIENLSLFVTGIRQGQNIDYEKLSRSELPLPPFSEQSAIVRFLDHADRRIQRYIRAKKKVIALLNDQRQVIIQRAVTCGLDPNFRLKPSGVEWLGNVPEHWSLCRVKGLARRGGKAFTDGDWIETPYITEEGVRLIQTGNVGIGEYREKGFRYISEDTFYALRCTEVKANDVLICRLDGPVGRACLAPPLGTRMITSVDNAILKAREDVDPRYVVHVMSSPGWLNWIGAICRAGGGFRYRISRSILGNAPFPLPPACEQSAIADFIDQESRAISIAINQIRGEIHRLREYYTRLISDVVTGKLDIREAAARLPEEVEEPELFDEAEVLAEDDEEVDRAILDEVPEETEA